MSSDEEWGRALFAAPRAAHTAALERATRVARAAVGRVDAETVEAILADTRAREMLAETWAEYPPDRWLLASAVERRWEGEDSLWRLLDQVYFGAGSEQAERARAAAEELDAWRRDRGALDWFTSAAPRDLVDLEVSGVELAAGRAIVHLDGPAGFVDGPAGLQVALTAWVDGRPHPLDVVRAHAGVVEVAWRDAAPQAWTAVGRRVQAELRLAGARRARVVQVRFLPSAAAGSGLARTSTPQRFRPVVLESASGAVASVEVTAGRLGSNVDVRLHGPRPEGGLWTLTGEEVTADRAVRLAADDRVLTEFLASALEFGQ